MDARVGPQQECRPAAHARTAGPFPGTAGCRVVKVGGSLLECPGLWRTLAAWLDAQPPLNNLLVVGGGELADQVRSLDRRVGLPQHISHWLAIQAMQLNGFVLSQLVPGARWTTDFRIGARDRMLDPDRWFLAIELFLRHEEPRAPGVTLPIGWHVTSDSIAARLATVCGAQELVLLKSALPAATREPMSATRAAALGFVDAYFPTSAAALGRIRVVNLRDPAFPEGLLTA